MQKGFEAFRRAGPIAMRSPPAAGPGRGIFWMLASAFFLAASNSLVRWVNAELHPLQTVFLALAIVCVCLLPWTARAGLSGFRTRRYGAYAALIATGTVTIVAWFFALSLAPLAEATAISFGAPLLVTAAAGLLLGERVDLPRWGAVIVGFAGTLIILRPGFAEFGTGGAVVLLATAGMAAGYLLTKMLAAHEPVSQIVAYTTFAQTAATFPLALAVWETPRPGLVPAILAMGATMYFGRLFMVRAFAAADASIVMPIDFARLPFIALMAYWAFDQKPDLWTWIGAALIVGAALFVMRREAGARRR